MPSRNLIKLRVKEMSGIQSLSIQISIVPWPMQTAHSFYRLGNSIVSIKKDIISVLCLFRSFCSVQVWECFHSIPIQHPTVRLFWLSFRLKDTYTSSFRIWKEVHAGTYTLYSSNSRTQRRTFHYYYAICARFFHLNAENRRTFIFYTGISRYVLDINIPCSVLRMRVCRMGHWLYDARPYT